MDNKKHSFILTPLGALQPSQLYINRTKLEALQSKIDFSDLKSIFPIPIKILDGSWVMTDGHTRAFAAHLAGLDTVPTMQDEDELDWDAYQICVGWCREAGIRTISDFEGRVIDPDVYEELWLARCKRMQDKLSEQRRDHSIKSAS